jgi:lipid-binding SYLF domain-containing protein
MIDTSMPAHGIRRRELVRLIAAALLAPPLLSACAGPFSTEPLRARERRDLETNVEATLERCYLAAPETRDLVARAAAVLVFPTVGPVNPVTGEWAGRGALREGSVSTGYFFLSTSADGGASAGKVRSIIYVFSSREALNRFRLNQAWRANEAAAAAVGAAGPASGVLGGARPGVVTLMLQGRSLVTNPTLPEAVVVPLDI